MNKPNFRTSIEIVGLFSLVASLIFVGLQLQQDRVIAEANQYQARAEMRLNNHRSFLESDQVFPVLAKVQASGLESLTPVERRIHTTTQVMEIIAYDNNFYQYELGVISEKYWESARKRIKLRLRDPTTRKFYRQVIPIMSSELAEETRKLILEVEREL